MSTTTTTTRTRSTIYRCRACERARKAAGEKRPVIAKRVDEELEVTITRMDTPPWHQVSRRLLGLPQPHPHCPTCNRAMSFHAIVKGTKNENVPCDGRCMGATGPNCECACGGKNHGRNHL